MPIRHSANRHDRNRQKNSRYPCQLRSTQNRKDDSKRVQVYALTNDAWVSHVIVNYSQYAEDEKYTGGQVDGIKA